MASRHHHHHACSRRHSHHDNIPLLPTSPRCCTFRDSPPCCNHPSPPPENLHHLLASYLQIQQQETHFPNQQTCSCNHKKSVPRQHDQVILSRLLRKIDDLESSLNKFAPFHDPQRREPYSTLRDSAARVIQTHFRSYLVRRSISFRHLKELALIKSSFLSLKSSVSGKTLFPFKVVSRKATDLLLQLDSIQGRIDPMIRSSKRSLSRDLVRFLQYVDDCVVRRYGYVSNRMEKLRNRMEKVSVTCDGDEELDSTADDSEDVVSVDKIKTGSSKFSIVKGNNVVKPTVRKTVVFDKNRNVYKRDVASSVEDDSVDSGEEESLDNERKQHGLKARNMVVVKGKNRVVKTVRFDEKNGNVYKVYGDTPEASISEEGDDDSTSGSNDGNGDKKRSGNEVVEIKYVPKENEGFEEEEEEEETQSEIVVSSSDGSEGDEHKKREIEVREGNLMFSPPLPLKMEP